MAVIKCELYTQEWEKEGRSGCWALHITAGLNEPVDAVLQDAFDRVKKVTDAIPEDKKYPRFRRPSLEDGLTE